MAIWIELHLPKATIILSLTEMTKLLYSNPEIYRSGLERGKAQARGEKFE
ncbi:hypothetical protein [Paenibacillus albus]|nr:hypothetical protein [Paenibacillus albus]